MNEDEQEEQLQGYPFTESDWSDDEELYYDEK